MCFVTVHHGLAAPPSAAGIRVTPTNHLGDAMKFWISDIGPETFRINVDREPGVDMATFAWFADR